MFTILPYTALAANSGAVYQNLTGVNDPEFVTRGGTTNNFIFTENYQILMAYTFETTITGARLDMPSINTYGRHHIHPLNRGIVVPSRPYIQDFRDYPFKLPTNEEMGVQVINGLAGTEQSTIAFVVAPTSWNRNLPRGDQRLTMHATVTPTGIANAWSTLYNLTFDEQIRAGWYAIVGAQVVGAGLQFCRFIFDKPPIVNGRRMRPGVFGQQLIGDQPAPWQMGGLGLFGQFNTFQPPQMEFFFNAAGAVACEVFLDLIFMQNSGNMAPPI